MFRDFLVLVVLLIFGALTFFLFTKIKFPALQEKALGVKQVFYTPENVPELADILSSDQTTRLNAARKLVERVDVGEALEILEHSTLPHTGEGHLVVHQVGFFAYKKYGPDAILKCKDYFLYACYHGAIIEAASKEGVEKIAEMTDVCKEFSSRYFQCVHAAGHATLALWEYQLDKALITCDELYEKEAKFPEALSSCHNGAFMENLFGVHDWGSDESPKQEWIRADDSYFPCNAFGEKYQKGCWLNQAARIYQMNNGDIGKTAWGCGGAEKSEYIEWCMDNLARQIHPLTNGDINMSFSLCSILGEYWREKCIIVNAGSFYSVGDSQSAIAICQRIIPPAQPECFAGVAGQIVGDTVDNREKQARCEALGGVYARDCLEQLKKI